MLHINFKWFINGGVTMTHLATSANKVDVRLPNYSQTSWYR